MQIKANLEGKVVLRLKYNADKKCYLHAIWCTNTVYQNLIRVVLFLYNYNNVRNFVIYEHIKRYNLGSLTNFNGLTMSKLFGK